MERNISETMTTNTPSQAASEIDVEFINLMSEYRHADSAEDHQKARRALVDYHEAKLAQEREEGRRDSHETNVTMLNLKLKADDRAAIAEDAWRSEKKRADEAEEKLDIRNNPWGELEEWMYRSRIATHNLYTVVAERDELKSRLAEIQRGVENLHAALAAADKEKYEECKWDAFMEVLDRTLLAASIRSDTSGLPG